ncbi:LysR family transcriptional regulator [Celerinatantimonas sp. YJH-8]|uniref:LysR family transcriptional regulator n=1 Tax=Celerinatantimonas sp. YJH-8 TaxID=3228714 RepID=UPI0038CA71EF
MLRKNFADLLSFQVVAREKNFTRAAAQLRLSQSALSHSIRALEERIGVRLLNRTTRRVSLTLAGEQLLKTLDPHLAEIENTIQQIGANQNSPRGLIRLSTTDHAANTVLLPRLAPFMRKYPDIHIEINVQNRFIDIVSERFDAGIRFGDDIAQDMVAVKLTGDMRMALVGSPEYFKHQPEPKTPYDLSEHSCINLRLMSTGSLYNWEFKKDNHEFSVPVNGAFTANTSQLIINAALNGVGLAYVPEDLIMDDIQTGKLVHVLEDWSPYFPGYYLYYPSRRQHNTAFLLLLEALRHHE